MPTKDENFLFDPEWFKAEAKNKKKDEEELPEESEAVDMPSPVAEVSTQVSAPGGSSLRDLLDTVKDEEYSYKPGARPTRPESKATSPDYTSAYNDLRSRLDVLLQEKETGKAEIDRRKNISSLIDALGMIAAGAYGEAKGLDMSGVKITPSSFEQDYEALKEKYKEKAGTEKSATDTALIQAREKYQDTKEKEAQEWKDVLDKYTTTEAQKMHIADQRMQDARYRRAAAAQIEAAKQRSQDKQTNIENRLSSEQKKALYKVSEDLKNVVTGKGTKDEKAAAAAALLTGASKSLGMSQDEIEELILSPKKSFGPFEWGGGPMAAADIATTAMPAISRKLDSGAQPAAPKSYDAKTEAMINAYMKQYPGRTREEIIKAMGI